MTMEILLGLFSLSKSVEEGYSGANQYCQSPFFHFLRNPQSTSLVHDGALLSLPEIREEKVEKEG